MLWDFLSSNQECVQESTHLFRDRGTPLSYRHTPAYGAHTFKFTKRDTSFKYMKVRVLSVGHNVSQKQTLEQSNRTGATRPLPTRKPRI